MKVKYAPPPNEKPTPWLTEGMEYVVLEIYVDKDAARYRILTEEDSITPTLHPASLFDIVSNKIPSSWVTAMGRARGFYLKMAPAKWTVPGFWETYFDHEPEAMKIFEQEKENILSEER